jgi:prepilin-type processing-associated H-X9-DG protein
MRNRGLTLVEVIVIIAAIVALCLMLLPALNHPVVSGRKANCKENLSQIGKAMVAYTQNNGDYFPFAWGPANGTCSRAPGGTDACDAATSLGCLYPQYINTPRFFRCTPTEDQPSFVVNTPQGVVSPVAQAYLWSQRNWTLTGNHKGRASSYGYDPRIYPAAVNNTAIMGYWDGSWQANPEKSTQNHAGGQNVLYVDGSVKWQASNYVSNDPIDNIFIEGGIDAQGKRVYWNADTDSFLVNGSVTLTFSYDRYPELQR